MNLGNTTSDRRNEVGRAPFRSRIRTILARLHLSRAIGWSLLGAVIGAVSGPAVALVITQKLSAELQGYYYTFNSLLAFSVLLELGFTTCIVQFVSHEFAKLRLDDQKLLAGPEVPLHRLVSLARLALRWYAWGAIGFLLIVGAAGEVFFRMQTAGSDWRGPWWLLCFSFSLGFALLAVTAILDGLNQVAWTTRIRAMQTAARSTVLVLGLWLGAGLYGPGLAALAAALLLFFGLRSWLPLLRQIMSCETHHAVSWGKELWPLQWRIGLSWASGYFIYNSFNPILFASRGAVVAGQFGMSWSIAQAANNIGQIFVATRAPKFGVMIANREYAQLRASWKVALFQSVGVLVCFVVGVGLTLSALAKYDLAILKRLLPTSQILLLLLGMVFNQITFGCAVLARAEKREPFMVPSLIAAGLIVTGNLMVANGYGSGGMTLIYAAVSGGMAGAALMIARTTCAFRQ